MFIGELMARLGVDTRQLKTAKAEMQQFGTQATSALGRVQSAIFSVQGAIATMGIGFAVRSLVNTTAEYESALIDMGKVTSQSFAVIDEQIKSMDSSLGNSIDLMKGYYQVISAGVTEPTEALGMLETASKLSKVAHTEQGETVRALTKLMAGYRGELASTTDAADLLLKTEKLGQTSVAELVPVIGDIATVSNMAGLRAEEMAGALALVTQTAGSTAEATTQLKALITTLVKPTEEMTALFGEFGGAVQAMEQLGLVEWLRRVRDSSKDAAEAATLLGGRKEALIGYSALLADDLKILNGYIGEMADRAGTLDDAWADFRETFAAVWTEFKDQFKDFMIELGQTILPALTVAVRALNEHFQTMVLVVKTLVGVFLGWKIGAWIITFAEFTTTVGFATKGITAVASTLASSIFANPATLPIVVAFVALIALLRDFNKQSKETQEQIRSTYSALGTGGGLLKDLQPKQQGEITYDETSWRNQIIPRKTTTPVGDYDAYVQAEIKSLKNLVDANGAYSKQLQELKMSAQELEMVKLDEWYKEQVDLVGQATHEMKALYDYQKKMILGPTPGEGLQEALQSFRSFAKDLSENAKTAMNQFGMSGAEAGAVLQETLLGRAEDTVRDLVNTFGNPYLRQAFANALGEIGRTAGNSLFQEVSSAIQRTEDVLEDSIETAEGLSNKLRLAWEEQTGLKSMVGGEQQFEVTKMFESANDATYTLSNGVNNVTVAIDKTVGKTEDMITAFGMLSSMTPGGAVVDPMKGVLDQISSLDTAPIINTVQTALQGLGPTGQDVGNIIGSGLRNGIVNAVESAVAQAKNSINDLATRITIDIKTKVGSVTESMKGDIK